MRPSPAGVAGYAAGMVLHYVLSVSFVFDAGATAKAHPRLFGEFAVTGLSGMAVTALVIAGATGMAGLAPLPAKILAAAASFLFVFALRRAVVFSARGTPGAPLLERGMQRLLAAVHTIGARLRALFVRISRRQPQPDLYFKLTVAGASFFGVLEITYFLFSPLP